MMKLFISISITFCLAMFSAVSPAANEKGPTVLDQGIDGKSRVYSVICANGNRASLNHKYNDNEICIFPPRGEPFCIKSNDTDDAARQACER